MPYFSILIPVYNVEVYLRQCLDSVLAQTFRDFEIIILDDGSTDLSGNICDEYAAKDNRIRVIHDKNMGLLMARRRALPHATGEYVLFLDSDDYWEKDLLEAVYQALAEQDADMAYLRYRAVDKDGKELYLQKKLLEDKELVTDAGKFLCYQLATGFEYNCMVLKAVKREKLDITGDYSKVKEVSMGEDALQSARLSANIGRMIYLAAPFYNYRVNISSISTKVTQKHLHDYLKVRKEIGDELKKYYETGSREYFHKLEYDIRGFVGLLADSAISKSVDGKTWKTIKNEIRVSRVFQGAYKNKNELSFISKIYIFFVINGGKTVWKLLGMLKRGLKYLYDRQKG